MLHVFFTPSPEEVTWADQHLATSIRAEVDATIFATILQRMGEAGRARMEGSARRRAGRQIDVQPAQEARPAGHLVAIP
ncbi:hypothetical protein [Sphaerisporangium sp. NPDC051011]|uniref:hypothetical protein n=1 Tax=Sphaerisporangium sp. NPDC051011 TaxID=3155792 RepID=UPI0033D6EC42